MENKVLQRLRVFVKSKGLTLKAFGDSVDVTEGTIKSMFNRGTNPSVDMLLKISNAYPNISLKWLLKGEGEMYNGNEVRAEASKTEIKTTYREYQPVGEPLAEYLPVSNFKLIPLVNMDVAGGSSNDVVDTPQYIEKYVPFIDAKDGDKCCPVTNNSMTPRYPPGTLVQIRKIEQWREFIEYGRIYVVDLKDGRRLIKQVKRGESREYYTLHSFNEEYDDVQISMNMIHSMWLVIAKYEKEEML